MTSAPANPEISTAKPATKFIVWAGDDSGGTPTAEDETTALKLLEITRSAGGRSLDTATFAYDLGETGERLVDLQTPDSWNRQIEVRLPDEDGEPTGQAAFWGTLSVQSIGISARDEAASVVSRIEPYHFGFVCTGYKVHNPLDPETVEIFDDIVFNPLIDGVIKGNKSSKIQTNEGNEYEWNLWVDPESMRTTEAQTLQDATASNWSLSDAIRSLCGMLNPAETYILNPTADELFVAMELANAVEPFNVRIRRGQFLPYYLDALLEPYGFGWFIRLGFDDDGLMTRKIAVFERGAGEEKEVFLQKPGEDLDLAETNLAELSLETSIADLANVVTGHGSKQEREVTIELYRGWVAGQDSFSCEDLDRTDPDSNFSIFQNARNTWRLWVANEAGDYTGLRDADDLRPILEPLDLSSVFDSWVPRRRRIGDCLTLDSSGRRRPPFVEWFNGDETDDDKKWQPLEPGTYSILNDQIGIYFNGTTPPSFIVAQGYFARIRITGTVQGDTRLSVRKTRRPASPNGDDVELFLDLSDRFHDRAVQQEGTYASVVYLPSSVADERDDETALEQFVERVRDLEDAAGMRAQVVLHGIHFDYEIGQVIKQVNGRKISFNRFSQKSEEKRYLQIRSISYDVQRQRTILGVVADVNDSFLNDPQIVGQA